MHAPSMGSGRRYTDLWIWNESPAPLNGSNDDANLGYHFPGPPRADILRVVRAEGPPPNYDPKTIRISCPARAEGRASRPDVGSRFQQRLHLADAQDRDRGLRHRTDRRTRSRSGRCRTHHASGDVVIQVGAWHRWACLGDGTTMMFDMISAKFDDGDAGLGQGRINRSACRPTSASGRRAAGPPNRHHRS